MGLVIKNCVIVKNHKPHAVDVRIEEGKIAQIGRNLSGDQVYHARGHILLPGFIDAHVHFREPGSSEKETWQTGTKAAVRGGVTTVMDMPNTNPPCVTAEDLERKRRHIHDTYANYGLHLGITAENSSLLHKMQGFAGAKLYMGSTTGNLLVEDEVSLYNALSSGKLVILHAEDGRLVQHFLDLYKKHPGNIDSIPVLHNYLRPNMVAELALAKALTIAKHVGGKVLVAHLSSKEEVALVRKAKRECAQYGFEVYAEVCPHHLFLTEESVQDNLGKVNPPLRRQEDIDVIWSAIHDGTVDILATDHAPHLWKEKQGPYLTAPSGISGIDTLVPLMLNAVNSGHLSLTRLQEIGAQRPAQIFGLNKGKIEVGYDADLVLVDMNEEHAISGLNFHSLAKFSPFDGMHCKGWPIATFVNGELVFEKRGQEEVFYSPMGKEIHYERPR